MGGGSIRKFLLENFFYKIGWWCLPHHWLVRSKLNTRNPLAQCLTHENCLVNTGYSDYKSEMAHSFYPPKQRGLIPFLKEKKWENLNKEEEKSESGARRSVLWTSCFEVDERWALGNSWILKKPWEKPRKIPATRWWHSIIGNKLVSTQCHLGVGQWVNCRDPCLHSVWHLNQDTSDWWGQSFPVAAVSSDPLCTSWFLLFLTSGESLTLVTTPF